MLVNTQDNTIHLKFDARNKQTNSYNFDKVADGDTGQKEFYKTTGISRMVKRVV
jgi:hypothetical protein